MQKGEKFAILIAARRIDWKEKGAFIMSKTTMIILGILAGTVMLCAAAALGSYSLIQAAGWVFGPQIQAGVRPVVDVSGKIADYTLPAGFGDGYAAEMAGYSLVGYTGDDGHSHIYFFQLPSTVQVDQSDLESQLQSAKGFQGADGRSAVQKVDSLSTTIAGQPAQLVVSQGTNSDGQSFREVTAIFQGKGGQALVSFERPVSRWDQAEAEAFIASIH